MEAFPVYNYTDVIRAKEWNCLAKATQLRMRAFSRISARVPVRNWPARDKRQCFRVRERRAYDRAELANSAIEADGLLTWDACMAALSASRQGSGRSEHASWA